MGIPPTSAVTVSRLGHILLTPRSLRLRSGSEVSDKPPSPTPESKRRREVSPSGDRYAQLGDLAEQVEQPQYRIVELGWIENLVIALEVPLDEVSHMLE